MELSMLYPVYVHLGDKKHAHGATIPDFPGCFSAADELDDLPAQVQEAVEVYFEGEDVEIPAPTPLEVLAADPEYQGGVWMLIDIDLSKVHTKAVRLNISLPERLVKQIDNAAKARHMTRSAFLALAAQHEMEHA
jgi:predicted RNase H-like HicB family nuclease